LFAVTLYADITEASLTVTPDNNNENIHVVENIYVSSTYIKLYGDKIYFYIVLYKLLYKRCIGLSLRLSPHTHVYTRSAPFLIIYMYMKVFVFDDHPLGCFVI
jgi:hypothetical protein